MPRRIALHSVALRGVEWHGLQQFAASSRSVVYSIVSRSMCTSMHHTVHVIARCGVAWRGAAWPGLEGRVGLGQGRSGQGRSGQGRVPCEGRRGLARGIGGRPASANGSRPRPCRAQARTCSFRCPTCPGSRIHAADHTAVFLHEDSGWFN